MLIGVLVSAQFAIAAYACPGSGQAGAEHVASPASMSTAVAQIVTAMDAHGGMDATGTPGHLQYAAMDPMLPNLCMGHCQFGQQTAEHTPAPTVAPVLLTALYTLPPLHRTAASGGPRATAAADGPPVSVDPPHAILHCCLRD